MDREWAPAHELTAHLEAGALFLYEKCFELRSAGEDDRRRELMLSVVLWTSLCLWLLSELNILESVVRMGHWYNGASPVRFALVGLFFVGLITAARTGYIRVATFVTVAVYFCAISVAAYEWGPSLPAALLGFAMVIAVSGVLVNTRFALLVTLASSAVVVALGYAEVRGVHLADTNWKLMAFHIHDAVEYSVMLGFIAVLTWLSNRETEASLARARRSENQLRVERDMLEVTVETRTAEVRRIQAERVSEVYRFVEFGRLASGLYHDLANHVGAVNMTIGAINSGAGGSVGSAEDIARTKSALDHAFVANKRLQSFVARMRTQLHGQQPDVDFVLAEELSEIFQLIGQKAEKCGVYIIMGCPDAVTVRGNVLNIHQVVTNLVSNAVDSYADCPCGEDGKPVLVDISASGGRVRLTISDRGCGIDPVNAEKIFQPFYTTKNLECGSGIGLAHTRDMVEKEMHGTIAMVSEVGRGTTFTVEFPQVHE